MTDYNIKAEITADSSGFESGIKKAEKAGKSLSKTLATVGLALNGLTATFKLISGAVSTVTKGMKECTDAFKVQLNAEKALDTAVKNSPLMNGKSAENLKKFASDMQKITNYGDEQLLPLITQLTTAGRTEQEAMQIVKTATDIAAGGTMSLDSAITQLNATMNGNIGRLGVQNKELKDLSKSQLEAGKAVEILGEKYKGMAQSSIDPSKQLNNLMGDLKETIGSKLYPTIQTFTIDSVKGVQKIIEKVNALNFDKIGATARVVFNDIKIFLTEATDKLSTISGSVKTIFSGFVSSSEFKKVAESVNLIVDGFVFLYNEVSTIFAEIRKKVADFALNVWEHLKDVFIASDEALADSGTNVASWADFFWEQFNNVFRTVQDVVNSVSAILHGDWTVAWEYTKLTVARVADSILDFLSTIVNAFPQMIDKITGFLNRLIEKINVVREFFGQDQIGLIEPLRKVDFSKSSGLEKFISNTEEKIQELTGKVADKGVKDIDSFTRGAGEKLGGFIDRFKQKVAEAEEENKLIIQNYNAEIEQANEDLNNDIESSNEKTFSSILATTMEYSEKIKKVFKGIVSVVQTVVSAIKSAINGAINIFTKLFKFDPDEALNNLLAFEDSVLTFFVETLPRLPAFFESAMSSVATLIDTLLETVDWAGVEKIINDIVETFNKYVPRILNGIIGIFEKLVEPVSNAILIMMNTIVDSGVFETISNFLTETIFAGLPSFLKSLIIGVVKSLKSLINVVVDLLPSLINAILEVLDTLIGEVLPELLPTLLDAILEIIKALVRAIPKLSGQIIKLVSAIIKALPPILSRLIPEIVQVVIEVLPQIITEVVKAVADLIKNLTTQDLLSIIFAVGEMIIKIAEAVITFIPNTIAEIFKSIKISVENMSWEGIKNAFKNGWKEITDNFKETWESAIKSISSSFENAFKVIKDVIQWIWDKIQSIIEGVGKVTSGLKDAVEKAGGGKVANFVETAVEKVADTAKKTGSAIKSGAEWVGGKIKGLFGFANGTSNAPKGLALVGEAGPELVRFNGGERVLNNMNTQKALAGISKGSSIFNVTFNNTQDTTAFAMMSQLKQYQRNLAFNGVL
jgi:phage-related protein